MRVGARLRRDFIAKIAEIDLSRETLDILDAKTKQISFSDCSQYIFEERFIASHCAR